jgi:hypothetical protein
MIKLIIFEQTVTINERVNICSQEQECLFLVSM